MNARSSYIFFQSQVDEMIPTITDIFTPGFFCGFSLKFIEN